MADLYDTEYVLDILRAAPRGMTQAQFRYYVQRDINGGWRREALEAERRYFSRENANG